jgi:uncharacterized protein (TIGR02284 family)
MSLLTKEKGMKFLIAVFSMVLATGAMADNTSLKDKAEAKYNEAKTNVSDSGKTTEGPTQLDDLIRGEMAAVRSYNTALEKAKGTALESKLQTIKKDHQDAVNTLQKFAGNEVKEDTQDSGVWGGFTKAFTGAASLMGNKTALQALNTGEKHGINEYQEALDDDTIKSELKTVIRAKLLPNQKKHFEELKSFL